MMSQRRSEPGGADFFSSTIILNFPEQIMTTLSVVIPAYNEEAGIANIIHRVLAAKPKLENSGVSELELLVVDDGSRDHTAEKAAAIPGVRLLRHPKNQGYGAALKTGFRQAKGELIGFLDADGTYPPEHFPDLCELALNGYDLVIGSRMAGAESEMPFTRRLGNYFFATLLSLLARQRVTDSASGMRIFKRETLERIYPLPDGLNLTPVMSARAIHEGFRVGEVAIPYSERVGRSKLSVVRDGSIFLGSIIWTVLTYNPARVFGILGLGGIALTLLVGLGLAAARLMGIQSLGPWGVAAVFTALVSGISGLSIFSLGISFNYLVALFYRRPIRQGLFGRPNNGRPVERHFWWLGLGGLAVGLALGGASLALGLTGWEISRLWLYLLGSALLILMSIQLIVDWLMLRVLAELAQREFLAEQDLNGKPITE
jgi:glycosyltransferase involved in cell wall biosynthesis